MKEKLFAVHVFIVYEQVLYQLENSAKPLHRKRRKFLREMLDYFTERLLLNPRLRGFLELDPNGESLHLESKSARKLLDAQRGYQKKRAAQDKTAIPIKYDLYGPFSNEGQQGLLETRN